MSNVREIVELRGSVSAQGPLDKDRVKAIEGILKATSADIATGVYVQGYYLDRSEQVVVLNSNISPQAMEGLKRLLLGISGKPEFFSGSARLVLQSS